MTSPPSTFTGWIARRRGSAGDIGDFARYAGGATGWPAYSSDRYKLREFLVRRRASTEVLDLFARVWDMWRDEAREE